MYSFEKKLLQQVSEGKTPKICFFDVDGTLFTPDIRYITASIYDSQTYTLLKKNNIPFIVITGRFVWNSLQNLEMAFYGLPKPDAIIFAGGAKMYFKKDDETYEENKNKENNLSPLKGLPFIDDIPQFSLIQEGVYATDVRNLPVERLLTIIDKLSTYYKNSASVFYSESIIRKNSLEVFSGSIYVTADGMTKEKAVKNIVERCEKIINNKVLEAYIFGDGSIDIPMLSIKSYKNIHISGYLVHPTPLARNAAKDKKEIAIIDDQGPKAILVTLRKKITSNQSSFSLAQNNPLRKIVQLFDPLLDKLTDADLTANDISLLGIKQVTKGAILIDSPNPISKILGLYLYLFGNLADVLDGIRARRLGKTSDGQLVDGFADRAKEFFQLYNRGKKFLKNNPEKAIQTLFAAISCALPSTARAQAEIQNIIVNERDSLGGSMIDRTKLLFASMFFELLNMPNKSFLIDKKMYQNNLATFKNRISVAPDFSLDNVNKKKLNYFQRQALERWLMYIGIFQDENNIIIDILASYPELKKEFLEKTRKYSFYLGLNTNTIRKENKINSFRLRISDIITL